jgi:hypothetical protein
MPTVRARQMSFSGMAGTSARGEDLAGDKLEAARPAAATIQAVGGQLGLGSS